jgi:hypothetical protein
MSIMVAAADLGDPSRHAELRVGCRAAREAGANVGRQARAGALAYVDGRSVEDDQQQR